jgi:EAL domain-containing protein (putative c-di-GMP-specific phosphodiesterase class I)/GGDEF domain-containing protein
MNINFKKKGYKIALISFIIFILFFFSVFFCTNRISNELERQLETNLIDVANQNALAISNQLNDNYMLLDSLFAEIKEIPGDMSENVMLLKGFVKANNLKRVGFCDTDGTTYTTDNVVANLSYREFFQRGMQGKSTITGVLTDALRPDADEKVIIFSSPMYDDTTNELLGVFGLIYDAEVINASLQVECFEGQGCSFATNEAGDISIAMSYDSIQLSQNLYTDILSRNPGNTEVINTIRRNISSNTPNLGKLFIDSVEYYYYRTPILIADGEIVWNVFTLVPTGYLLQRLKPVRNTMYLMIFLSIFLVVAAMISYLIIFSSQRRLVQRLAYRDSVTGGANYAYFKRQLLTKSRNRCGYIVSMDIQHFSNITITAGSAAADDMIKKTWELIKQSIKDNEYAARVRDDYFVMLLNMSSDADVSRRLEQLSDEVHDLAIAYDAPGVRACFGIYPMEDITALDDSYNKAKIGREFAKERHDKCYAFYSELDHEELLKNQQLEERFDFAISNHNFEIWYQPKYSASTKEIVGSEALVRWRETDGKLIPPGRFIPLFERDGYISRLDEYVFREVCHNQKYWLDKGFKVCPVSVNISRATIYGANVVDKYLGILDSFELPHEYIQLEVLESAISGNADIAKILERFRLSGVHILMDDFGTGYSSLATLNMHCFDTLKLDKSLIDCIGGKDGETLLHYVIKMGRHLGLHITAEGVEYESQLSYLQEQKCDDIQGYLFSKPLHVMDYERLITV